MVKVYWIIYVYIFKKCLNNIQAFFLIGSIIILSWDFKDDLILVVSLNKEGLVFEFDVKCFAKVRRRLFQDDKAWWHGDLKSAFVKPLASIWRRVFFSYRSSDNDELFFFPIITDFFINFECEYEFFFSHSNSFWDFVLFFRL